MKNLINESLHEIKNSLELNSATLAEMMDLPLRSFSRSRADFSRLPVSSLVKLSDHLGVGLHNLERGTIDYDVLREHYRGNKTYLSRRHTLYPKSKIATIANSLNFISKYISPSHAAEIKKELQLTDEILNEKERPVCGLLLIEIFHKLQRLGVTSHGFKMIGSMLAAQQAELLDLNKRDAFPTNLKSFWEMAIESSAQRIEKNMFYSIEKASSSEVILKAVTRPETQEALGIKKFGDDSHRYNIWGYCEGISSHLFKKPCSIDLQVDDDVALLHVKILSVA